MKINVLPREVYNRISAGEVVDNPRSVVKELVENAIDAGATSVSVYVEDGGIKSVTVIDNGHGIEKSEVETAFLPHATSKIQAAEDLETLSTLGFRGEALPSIAAVSEVTLITKYKDDAEASKIIVKGGHIIDKSVAQIGCGTNVEVKNLFFNTPARFKFLKSIKSEEAAITSVMTGFILANPEIEFKYYVDGTLKFESSEKDLLSAACTVFSSDFADKCAKIYLSERSVTVSGYTSLPEISRGNRNMQYLIINGRIVNDAAISAVVQNAYENRLMTRMFPIFVLDIVMPFDSVDVNVHPNKLEVRLANPRLVHGLVYKAVKDALEKADEEKSLELLRALSPLNQRKSDNPPRSETEKPKSNETSTFVPSFDVETESKPNPLKEENKRFTSKYENVDVRDLPASTSLKFNSYGTFTSEKFNYETKTTKNYGRDQTPKKESSEQISLLNKEVAASVSYNIVGQIFDTYVLAEFGNELLIIDQHAAHERILFNKLTDAFSRKTSGKQILLYPLEFTPSERYMHEFLISELPSLEEIGFDVIDKGNGKIEIKAIPEIMTGMNIERVMNEFCSDYKLGEDNVKTVIKDKLARAACRSAIKGGDNLSAEATAYFLEYYIKEGVPLQCPHGRPTIVKMHKKDFEKMFKRLV